MLSPALLLLLGALQVEVMRCELSAHEISRIASIELARAPQELDVRASVICSPQFMEIEIEDRRTQKIMNRQTPLAQLPMGTRERFAALAIAELVESGLREPMAPTDVDATVRPQTEDPVTTRRVRLLAAGTVRVFPGVGLLQVGAAVRAHVALLGPIGLTFDVAADHGSTRLIAGRVDADSVSAGLFVHARGEWSMVSIAGGVGIRAGWARLQGFPDDDTVFTGGIVSAPLGGPALMLDFGLQLRRFLVSLGFEAGLPVYGLEGLIDGERGTGFTGAWFAASLGIGARL